MKSVFSAVAAALMILSVAAAQPDFSRVVKEFDLPAGLVEISGLALSPGGGLFAHNDEYAIVYEVSADNGEILRAFALGDPTVQADFEGVAVSTGRVYLIDSDGRLYESEIGAHRERMKFNAYDTGVGEYCEVEGLAVGPSTGEFLIACKTARDSRFQGRLVIFRWSLAARLPLTSPWIDIKLSDILTAQERRDFRPSAIEWRAGARELIVVSARNRMILALSPTGHVTWKAELSPEVHFQAEGLAVSDRIGVVIADEGARRGPGKIRIYSYNQQAN